MGLAVVLQQNGLTEVQEAVRETLSAGGSKILFVAVLGLLAGLVLLTHWLTKKTNRDYVEVASDRGGLFTELLGKLELAKEQRLLLEVTAKRVGLIHPAVLLLSPVLFDQSIERCRKKLSSTKWRRPPEDFDAVACATRNALFA